MTQYDLQADSFKQAIIKGNFTEFDEMLNDNPDLVNQVYGTDKITPVHYAAMYDRADMLVVLAHSGADLNPQAANKDTPLVAAVSKGNLGAVEVLLDQGAKPRDIDGAYPLNVAASFGYDKIVQKLVEGGADPDEKKPNGDRPLHSIARSEHAGLQQAVNIMNVLVIGGADLQAKNNDDQTPADVAVDQQRRTILTTGYGGTDFKLWQAANQRKIELRNRQRPKM